MTRHTYYVLIDAWMRCATCCAESNPCYYCTKTASCRELSFEKYDKNKSLSKSDIRRNRIIVTSKRQEAISNPNTRQPIRRGKDERKGLHCKGIAKSPHASQRAENAPTRCGSNQNCSQNAILFSQQQMNDIERLAWRLMTKMQSMKYIL